MSNKSVQRLKASFFRRTRRYLKRILKRNNYSHSIKVNKVSIDIPSINGIKCMITEPWMIELLEKLLKDVPEGVFIDVGINIGQTLIKLKSIDPDRKYIGFEPNPACVYYVNELIKKNRFSDCTILPVGLYTQDQVLPLNLFSKNDADSSASMIENFRPNKVFDRVYVPVFRFETLATLFNFDDVAIVKIDVEGAELEVIKSLLEIIKNYRPIVLLEILPVYNQGNTFRIKRQEGIEKIFNSIDYCFYRIKKYGDKLHSLEKIESIGIHSDLSQCDYMVAPNEFIHEL